MKNSFSRSTMICLLVLLGLIPSGLFAQTKYFIYFTDKGVQPTAALSKSSAGFIEAVQHLSPRSIARRQKTMGPNSHINYDDLKIPTHYIQQLEKFGVKIHRQLRWFNAVSCNLSAKQLAQIKKLPFVEKITPVRRLKQKERPPKQNKTINRQLQGSTEHLYNYGPSLQQYELSDIPQVHDLGIAGKGVLIGFLDTGYRLARRAFQNTSVIAEYDFIFDDSLTANEALDSKSQDHHGTYTLSICGGYDDGCIVGAAYQADFILAKTEDIRSETQVEEDNYAAALEWMEGKGVDITTASLGYTDYDDGTVYDFSDFDGQTIFVTQALNKAFERGVVTVNAAGNYGAGGLGAPADAFNVFAVGAVSSTNEVVGFSSRGPTADGRIKPEVVAQGSRVYGSDNDSDTYYFGSGTSAAAPIIAGIAGLVLSTHPHLNNFQVRSIFLECGDNVEAPNNDCGWGLVSAARVISFPNLQEDSGNYILHKIFLPVQKVVPKSAKIHFGPTAAIQDSAILTFDDSLKFNFQFPQYSKDDSIDFYFTFTDSAGNRVQEPAIKNYRFAYGDLIIHQAVFQATEIAEKPLLPKTSVLFQNYPNPFNPATTIKFSIQTKRFVSLKIYDLLGREIQSLLHANIPAGSHSVEFNGANLASGVYFYRLQTADYVATKKLILMR